MGGNPCPNVIDESLQTIRFKEDTILIHNHLESLGGLIFQPSPKCSLIDPYTEIVVKSKSRWKIIFHTALFANIPPPQPRPL
ncbi:hypothetical protein M758_UG005500, partial [Ceratodon purpureus]